MFIVRNVFRTHPGKAKELVKKFKTAEPHLKKMRGVHGTRILSDAVAGFWTVIHEVEVEDMNGFFNALEARAPDEAIRTAMAGYMDLIQTGHREVFRIE
jgi:heme-degrading monooxygenase HmoA